jgi:pimeloyl-ACP methyl ester carboxylesterase
MKQKPKLAIHELHDGGGLPVVLLHPFPVDSRSWGPVAKELPFGIRAIAVDLPGFGKSEIGGLAPSIDLVADAVYEALTDYGLGNAIVVGWSMGGYVALALAERHPNFVSGLGLVGSKATADSPDAAANRLRLARDVEMAQSVDPIMALVSQVVSDTTMSRRRQLFSQIEAWMRNQSPAGVAWAQRAMARRPDRMHVLEHFRGPVAVIVGHDDRVSPVAHAQQMAGRAAAGSLYVIPGSAHYVALEDPKAVAEAITLLHGAVVPQSRLSATRR